LDNGLTGFRRLVSRQLLHTAGRIEINFAKAGGIATPTGMNMDPAELANCQFNTLALAALLPQFPVCPAPANRHISAPLRQFTAQPAAKRNAPAHSLFGRAGPKRECAGLWRNSPGFNDLMRWCNCEAQVMQ
jgi:hypothetical protein